MPHILCIFAVLALAGCEAEDDTFSGLNGIWSGNIEGDNISIVFIDDLCFIITDVYTERAGFNFEDDSGNILIYDDILPFTAKRDNLSLSVDGITVELTRDKTAAAPEKAAGIWYGAYNTIMAFINNKVFFIDHDGDPDNGFFTFDNNEGSFITLRYRYNVNFTVSDEELIAKFESSFLNEELTFAREIHE